MTRKYTHVRAVLTLSALCLGLSACGGVRKEIGLGRSNPDEFAVVAQAPLSLPPDYDLRPPQPGAPRPQDITMTRQAEQSLFRPTQSAARTSNDTSFPGVTAAPRMAVTTGDVNTGGEDKLLSMAGADHAPSDIRAQVNRESSQLAEEEKTLRDSIVFWRDAPPPGTIVDAEAEQKRLKDNQALNQPVNKGETPTIDRKGKGTLGGLF